VLRIFDSQDHRDAYNATQADQRDFDQRRREVLFQNNPDEGGATGFKYLLLGVLWQMFDDVDPGVLPAIPRWIDNGCYGFTWGSKFDGKKLEFSQSDVEKERMALHFQQAEKYPFLDLWDIIQEQRQKSPTDGSNERLWDWRPESSRLMRWFWSADGLKAFNKPTLIGDYVRAIGQAHAELGPDPTADAATVGLTDDQQKEANKRHYKWRDDLLVKVNNIVLPLQPDVWRAINEKWVAFNKTLK
jgi:hypothetical protein